jgi:hypothetical protein
LHFTCLNNLKFLQDRKSNSFISKDTFCQFFLPLGLCCPGQPHPPPPSPLRLCSIDSVSQFKAADGHHRPFSLDTRALLPQSHPLPHYSVTIVCNDPRCAGSISVVAPLSFQIHTFFVHRFSIIDYRKLVSTNSVPPPPPVPSL